MAYSEEITTNGEVDTAKVLLKMNSLRDDHIAGGTDPELAKHFAGEFGTNLIGWAMAEAWLIGQKV